jgi:hypothetical protein
VRRAAFIGLAVAGCVEPEVRAWHGAFEVRSLLAAEGSCDGALAEAPPPEPWMFVAVDTAGLLDVVTLYWCPEPKDCGLPYDTAYLERLTERRLEGRLVLPLYDIGMCNAKWAEIVGEQDEQGNVSISYRGGEASESGMSEDSCADFALDLEGEVCDRRIEVEGRR